MSKPTLNLNDLTPRQSTFTLAALPGKTLTLRKWSLRARAWASEKWGSKQIERIFKEVMIEPISQIAWFLLIEKSYFDEGDPELTPFERFLESISGIKEELTLVQAMLETLGVGEPDIEEIKKAAEEAGVKFANPSKPQSNETTENPTTGDLPSTL